MVFCHLTTYNSTRNLSWEFFKKKIIELELLNLSFIVRSHSGSLYRKSSRYTNLDLEFDQQLMSNSSISFSFLLIIIHLGNHYKNSQRFSMVSQPFLRISTQRFPEDFLYKCIQRFVFEFSLLPEIFCETHYFFHNPSIGSRLVLIQKYNIFLFFSSSTL